MAIVDVDANAVRGAIARFDREMRETEDWAGWENQPRFKYALVEEGRKYPPKEIVSLATGMSTNEFSGGTATNQYLRKRGFVIAPLRTTESVKSSLETVLEDYPTARRSEDFGKDSSMSQHFATLVDLLQKQPLLTQYPYIKVEGSVGGGNWASVPWLAFLDRRETVTTTRGIYVVILFRDDGSGLYFTLNQGTTEPAERLGRAAGRTEVEQRAQVIRARTTTLALAENGFELDNKIDLRSNTNLGRSYEPSTIAHKFYGRGEVGDDPHLLEDLKLLFQAYDAYVSEGRPDMSVQGGIHVLLKWSAKEIPDTVERHKAIADESGMVWWANLEIGGFRRIG